MLTLRIHIPSLILGLALGALLLFAQGRFLKSAHEFRADFISGQGERACRLDGFGGAETGARGPMRWSFGPEASIQFFVPVPEMRRELVLTYKLISPIPDQDLEVVFNGKVVSRLSSLPASPDWSRWYGESVTLAPQLGPNTLSFRVSRWNGHQGSIAPEDDRPLALMFQDLTIFPQ